MDRHRHPFVLDHRTGQCRRPVRGAAAAPERPSGALEIGMMPAAIADFHFHPMQPRVVAARRQRGATPQVWNAPAADDADERLRLGRDVAEPLAADVGEHRHRRIGMELGQRAVEIRQEHERLLERKAGYRVLYVGQHRSSTTSGRARAPKATAWRRPCRARASGEPPAARTPGRARETLWPTRHGRRSPERRGSRQGARNRTGADRRDESRHNGDVEADDRWVQQVYGEPFDKPRGLPVGGTRDRCVRSAPVSRGGLH